MRSGKVKRLAVCSLLSALGVVILSLGRFIDVLDASMAVLASLTCVIAVIEYGKLSPWLVFAVTSVLSLILQPDNSAAWMYLLFFGFYPILKEKLERLGRVLSWVLKETVFNVSLAVIAVVTKFLLMPEADSEPWWMYLILIVLAEAAFVLYDVALTRVISFYIFKLRDRLKLK